MNRQRKSKTKYRRPNRGPSKVHSVWGAVLAATAALASVGNAANIDWIGSDGAWTNGAKLGAGSRWSREYSIWGRLGATITRR